MNIRKLLVMITVILAMQACSARKVIISHDVDLSKYSYVVFGDESTGNRELDEVMMAVCDEIAATRLVVISEQEGMIKVAQGESVLSPSISISTENWDGGQTYITITFYDYDTDKSVAVLKSSGMGFSVSHDQNIAIDAIRKDLEKIFGKSMIK